jgi:hypothetical protein
MTLIFQDVLRADNQAVLWRSHSLPGWQFFSERAVASRPSWACWLSLLVRVRRGETAPPKLTPPPSRRWGCPHVVPGHYVFWSHEISVQVCQQHGHGLDLCGVGASDAEREH